MTPPLPMVLCSWCQSVIRWGVLPVSHGICIDCSSKVSSELDAQEAERALRAVVLDVEKKIEEAARQRRVA